MDHLIHLKHFLRWQKYTSAPDMQQLPYLTFYKPSQCEASNSVRTAGLQLIVFYNAVSGVYPIYFLLCSYQ